MRLAGRRAQEVPPTRAGPALAVQPTGVEVPAAELARVERLLSVAQSQHPAGPLRPQAAQRTAAARRWVLVEPSQVGPRTTAVLVRLEAQILVLEGAPQLRLPVALLLLLGLAAARASTLEHQVP